jgi:transcription initiation factor TFIIA small subunit
MEGEKKNAVSVYSLYRKSTLGICLQDALDDLQERNHIGADLAQKVLEQFDKVLPPFCLACIAAGCEHFLTNRCARGDSFSLRGALSLMCAPDRRPLQSMSEALATRVRTRFTFKGHLHTYRLVDNVWTFLLEDTTFRSDTDVVTVDLVKIVACEERQPGQPPGAGAKAL